MTAPGFERLSLRLHLLLPLCMCLLLQYYSILLLRGSGGVESELDSMPLANNVPSGPHQAGRIMVIPCNLKELGNLEGLYNFLLLGLESGLRVSAVYSPPPTHSSV